MSYENSRQRRKREAEQHNIERAELLSLEQDRREHPEKYQRKRSRRVVSAFGIYAATAMALTATKYE